MECSQVSFFDGEATIVDNPLKGRRVGFIGKFRNRNSLIRKVKEMDASSKSKEGITKDTQILVIGEDVSQNVLNRLECYEHDGWHPLKIREEDLNKIFSGFYSDYITPEVFTKCVDIDISYYYWDPPILTDAQEDEETETLRKTSPLKYNVNQNPISGMEIFVPNIDGADMSALCQLIGNFGGFANREYYDETDVVLLSDDTLQKLKQGIKDDVIRQIEDKYNASSINTFNVVFSCESDLISWIEQRLETHPDDVSQRLLHKYLNR